ncbi:hypothetical protein F5051DRAFT_429273 [Lentinula edodes]|nr:hypothetical protein F5051DRAFT_429273 [Lentinula edodes]
MIPDGGSDKTPPQIWSLAIGKFGQKTAIGGNQKEKFGQNTLKFTINCTRKSNEPNLQPVALRRHRKIWALIPWPEGNSDKSPSQNSTFGSDKIPQDQAKFSYGIIGYNQGSYTSAHCRQINGIKTADASRCRQRKVHTGEQGYWLESALQHPKHREQNFNLALGALAAGKRSELLSEN